MRKKMDLAQVFFIFFFSHDLSIKPHLLILANHEVSIYRTLVNQWEFFFIVLIRISSPVDIKVAWFCESIYLMLIWTKLIYFRQSRNRLSFKLLLWNAPFKENNTFYSIILEHILHIFLLITKQAHLEIICYIKFDCIHQ